MLTPELLSNLTIAVVEWDGSMDPTVIVGTDTTTVLAEVVEQLTHCPEGGVPELRWEVDPTFVYVLNETHLSVMEWAGDRAWTQLGELPYDTELSPGDVDKILTAS